MSGSIDVNRNGEIVTIRVSGHFGFPIYREFREAYREDPPGRKYVIDLADAEYMDSSALGMLLVLREYAGSEQQRIEIANATPEVRKILQIAHFDRLFHIR